MAKKKKQRKDAPVPTGHDDRSEQTDSDRKKLAPGAAAPDGVSGVWS